MEYNKMHLREVLEEADMILLGLGEEFEQKKFLNTIPQYHEDLQQIKKTNKEFLIPLLDSFYLKKYRNELVEAYQALGELLQNKNYFIVSTVMNESIYECGCFAEGKIVTPCGGYRKVQCINGCRESLMELSEVQKLNFAEFCEGKADWNDFVLGTCKQCGQQQVLNNVYLENYLEEGYLPDWERYMKWTQGTLNKKVVVLEMGVGLQYPGIIRWPFEKIAFFNQKASFYRIHESLYQMTEELQNKGISIRKNAVDFCLGR